MTFLLENRNLLISLTILFCGVFISKEIILLNEEILVALCFVLFMLVASKYVGQMISDELDDRAAQIKKDFILCENEKKKKLLLLGLYHARRVNLGTLGDEVVNRFEEHLTDISIEYKKNLVKIIQTKIETDLRNIYVQENIFLKEVYSQNFTIFFKILRSEINKINLQKILKKYTRKYKNIVKDKKLVSAIAKFLKANKTIKNTYLDDFLKAILVKNLKVLKLK